MKANVLIFTSLCLLLFWMLPVGSKKINGTLAKQEPQSIPLDMCENSVDDMYSTCVEKMGKKINDTYFKREMNLPLFKDVWQHAENCANRNYPKDDNKLTKVHKQAICVYTSGYEGFYDIFNKAVRTQRKDYKSSFQFHSLHFWLTRAVQILLKNQKCLTTYRRSKTEFTGEVNKVIRFGSFTSTSKLPNLTQFGAVTCFKVKTCSGAYLQNYPELRDKEQEVLVPPYEKFKIKEKCNTLQCKLSANLPDCKNVYVLESFGNLSNLDCQLAKPNI